MKPGWGGMILEDIITDFIAAVETESAALFLQGDILVSAERKGYNIREIDKTIASQARMSRVLVYTRYVTSKVFPAEKRNPELNWTIHRICATTDAPEKWLAVAADEQLSTRQLQEAIAVSKGEAAKGVYLLDKQPCMVYQNHDGSYTLIPDSAGEMIASICYAPNSDLSQTPAM